MSQKRHVQTSRNFLYMLRVAVVNWSSSSDKNALRYVLPFCGSRHFSHNGAIYTHTGHWRIIHRDSPGGTGAKSAVDCCLVRAIPVHYKCQCVFYENVQDDIISSKIIKISDTSQIDWLVSPILDTCSRVKTAKNGFQFIVKNSAALQTRRYAIPCEMLDIF